MFGIKKKLKKDLSDLVIRPKQSATFVFSDVGLERGAHHRLYFTCEDRMHYAFKTEPRNSKLYQLIDDSLDTEHARNRRYCLDMSCCDYIPYAKRAATKVVLPSLYDYDVNYKRGENWSFGISVMAEGLRIAKGGYLRFCLERWNIREGVPYKLTKEAPDDVTVIDIPEGNYDYTQFLREVRIPYNTACMVIILEGEGYCGNVYFEDPFLRYNEQNNICPDFDLTVPNLEEYVWVGQSLSKKEWPIFEIELNGQLIFNGEKFLRMHRYAPVEIDIPDETPILEKNELKIIYLSDYHDTVPLAIREVMILERPKKPFSITAYPETVRLDKEFGVLIRTEEDGVALTLEGEHVESLSKLYFENKGLHVARFRVRKSENHIKFSLSFKEITEKIEILQVVIGDDDNVICGSGDLIYIDNADESAVEDYLEWFLHNQLGNLVTIRPAYRWGGQRTINGRVWSTFRRICEGMGLKYAHMLDGRDLPSQMCNPHPDMLKGKNFLGRQIHERDGQIFYWGYPTQEEKPNSEVRFDILMREARKSPLTMENTFRPDNIAVYQGQLALVHNTDCRADMKEAYEAAMRSIRVVHMGNPRHTGPSVLFKYFYEAGYEWLGAETMDSTMEALIAFLRGAAKAYEKKSFGVHHAVQWATYPQDTEQNYRRFLLALYTSYMQGADQINTEEGFWHMEEGFAYHNRFSDACARHRDSERRFLNFVSSHVRSGRYYTPIAFLHGRCDGWQGFGDGRVWGMPHMTRVSEAEASWTLMHMFYPLDRITAYGMAVQGISPECDDKPRGMYSGTPNGNFDVLPVEIGDYSDYKLLAFLGYNLADRHDFDRLLDYVERGGILLACRPHFSAVTSRDDILAGRFAYYAHPLTELLSVGEPQFEDKSYKGSVVSVAVNLPKDIEVIETVDDGTPLVFSVRHGQGRIVLVNANAYPANREIRPVYENILRMFHNEFDKDEPNAIYCGEDVEYTVYLQENGDRHYYVTAVDWYNDPKPMRKATVRVGDSTYPIELSFGKMYKIVANATVAAWTEEENATVLSIEPTCITVQGLDAVTLYVVKDGKMKKMLLDFSRESVLKISI